MLEKKGIIEEGITPPEEREFDKEKKASHDLEDHSTKRFIDQVLRMCNPRKKAEEPK